MLVELDKLGAVIVISSGNYGGDRAERVPAVFADPLVIRDHLRDPVDETPPIVLVGATDVNSRRYLTVKRDKDGNPIVNEDGNPVLSGSVEDPYLTTYAPGAGVPILMEGQYMAGGSGTSHGESNVVSQPEHVLTTRQCSEAAPMVASLAAYFRSMRSHWEQDLQRPANARKLIQHFSRSLAISDPRVASLGDVKDFIWNGQVREFSCLVDRPFPGDEVCGPPLPENLADLHVGGDSCLSEPGLTKRQLGADVKPCSMSAITVQPGQPSPTCGQGCTPGRLCTDAHCTATPGPTGPFPTLPPPPISSFPASTCLSSTRSTRCVGEGPHTNCDTATRCLTWGTPPAFPTLPSPPPTSLSVPSGSVCVATATLTSCALGPGGQTACVTRESCADFSASPTPTKTSEKPAPTKTDRPRDSWAVGFYADNCAVSVSPGRLWGEGTRECSSVDDADCMNGSVDEYGPGMYICGYTSRYCTEDDADLVAVINEDSYEGHAIIYDGESIRPIRSWRVSLGGCPLIPDLLPPPPSPTQ